MLSISWIEVIPSCTGPYCERWAHPSRTLLHTRKVWDEKFSSCTKNAFLSGLWSRFSQLIIDENWARIVHWWHECVTFIGCNMSGGLESVAKSWLQEESWQKVSLCNILSLHFMTLLLQQLGMMWMTRKIWVLVYTKSGMSQVFKYWGSQIVKIFVVHQKCILFWFLMSLFPTKCGYQWLMPNGDSCFCHNPLQKLWVDFDRGFF